MFSFIMDLCACFVHLLWIYENVFIYHGFMSMFFSSIMDLWTCFHLSFLIHSITSSICICDKLYHKKKRKTFSTIMFSFVILCQLLGTFILHISQFVSCLFYDANNKQSLVDRLFDIPKESKSKNRLYNDHILFKLCNGCTRRHSTFSLSFLFEVKM